MKGRVMLKYVNTDVVFQEIPDEVTLAINISNCPCHCPGCHSRYLWEDIGLSLERVLLVWLLWVVIAILRLLTF